MQFYLHAISSDAASALKRHGHTVHTSAELDDPVTPSNALGVAELLELLTARQWCLLTTDRDLVQGVYDRKISFSSCIVFLQGSAATDSSTAIDRLFARYPRLSPRRLYTVTKGRVKIRQLPGKI
jgi:hypothetical protein